ncbi:hypothetical protein IEU95_08715 [Hoyosella rhizosphaerae]|uniref:Uncharacterized protein n=1 Tax=Hoyosella rhizosphaerae TaxID=1755582 RepID=A0A916X9V7_9ACTN|nr:hypothetical protein [Hoyosella rhizosphaerae]MBN4926911.1 hypothetical protein [Hoyosella rhizosphaerae]GGC55559.1 hypothetical protein GCM10011410_04920 [Hoyosella rhizosphaerae]
MDTVKPVMGDLERQAQFEAVEAKRQEMVRKLREAQQPILADLRAVGFDVPSVWSLGRGGEGFSVVLPVLLKHLERGGYPDRIMGALASRLGVKEMRPYWDKLRDMYVRATGPHEKDSLAAALAETVTREREEDLISLIRDDSLGDSRIMLLRGLIRLRSDRSRAVMDSLVDHPVLGKAATRVVHQRKLRQARKNRKSAAR